MKRLALIVVGVAALASFNVTAQTPAAARGRADVRQGRRADHVQQVRELPPARRSGADVAAVVRGRAAVGQGDQDQGGRARDAAVGRGHVADAADAQRHQPVAERDRHHRRVGRWRRRQGQRRGHAAVAEVRDRLDRRHRARSDPRDAGRVRHSRRRRARRADVLFEGAVDRRQVRGDRRAEAEQPRRAASRRHFLRRHSRRRDARRRPHRRQGRQGDRRSRIARAAVDRQRPARIEQAAVVGAGPRPRSSSRRHRQAPARRQVHQLADALQPDRQAGEGSHAARHLVQQGAGDARSADPPGRRSAGDDQGRVVDLSRRRPRNRIQGRPEQHAPQPHARRTFRRTPRTGS